MKGVVFLSLIINIILYPLFLVNAQAATKTSGDLRVTFDEPLFPNTILWYPGYTVNKNIAVENLGNNSQSVFIEAVNEAQIGNLANALIFSAQEGLIDRYGGSAAKTLQNFYNDGQIILSNLNSNSSANYNLALLMNTSAGNEYQAKRTTFDLRIGFQGTASEVTVSGSTGESSSNPPVPTCGDSTPGSAPTLLSAVSMEANKVTLAWSEALGPVTYYLVSYRTTGGQQYGNPNVGGIGTTSYTITNLSGGETYYFKVRAGNGCMPGDFSGELSAVPSGGIIAGQAEGFQQNVLGIGSGEESTSSAEATSITPAVSIFPPGEVQGIASTATSYWWLLFFGAGGLAVLYWLVKRRISS